MASHSSGDEGFGANDWLIEEMLDQYREDPDSVDPSWRQYFEAREGGNTAAAEDSPQAKAATRSASPEHSPAPQQAERPDPVPKPAPTPAAAPQAKPNTPAARPAATPKPSEKPAPQFKDVKAVPKPAEPKHPVTDPAKTEPSKAVPADRKEASGKAVEAGETKRTVLKGAPMRTARNMEASIAVPTATTVRDIPMKLIIENRTEINNHLKRTRGGKVSFTHIIGYAMVQAIKAIPAMNNHFEDDNGKAVQVVPGSINLGIAIDVKKADGTRNLMVPCIKGAEQLDFSEFVDAYEILVKKGRTNTLGVDDFAGTTVSLTNPGGIGTNHSLARLMAGQGVILGVGAVDYPVEFKGVAQSRLDDLGISKITTFTSTYDHRVIQGAQSGEFLKMISELLLGEHGFYDDIYEALRIPHPPLRWGRDIAPEADDIPKTARVMALIDAYRQFGNRAAAVDPLEFRRRSHPDLELEAHGLTIWDLDRTFATGYLGDHHPVLTLRDILDTLRDTYCRTSTVEYMYISDPEQRAWFQKRVERPYAQPERDDQLRILDRLIEAEIFETFLQTKFIGQKRFSLEGGESTIVMLDKICQQAARAELSEVCIGMPHRGRLNVLTNIVGKSYGQVFREFQDKVQAEGTGDVKYHLGATGTFKAGSGEEIAVSVAANPSHLEAVNPVLEGIARAKQDQWATAEHQHPVLPILLHGDASFAGQGVNFETMQMAMLRAYETGGTIHVVVNNQIGFTTSPHDSRSTAYCTDIAKGFDVPVFHVNGDDPEACLRVAQLAFEYRAKFHRDVVIDLVCYRLRGHNEGDDPSFTNPTMYDLIDAKRSTRKLYTEALIGRGDISTEEAEKVQAAFHARLEKVFDELKQGVCDDDEYTRVPYYPAKPEGEFTTAVDAGVLDAIASAYRKTPEGFTLHPKVEKQLHRRADDIEKGTIDWATGEAIAMASLALEGHMVRLVGQDCQRGTFSQRYGVVIDRENGAEWTPLAGIRDDEANIEIYNSLLSEYACMGFEYGYSVARPDALVMWEAQFGDFANGAQTIADEFIAAGKAKWGQNSGVALLLPHGYEGQGPDHSSARIERWLQLCSEGALAVCQPSTSASYFHLLRQHAYVNWHRPVVILTPKSMLRAKPAQSTREDFTTGTWSPALGDKTITDPAAVKRIVLCSGKVRWELIANRAKQELDGEVAIISLERLYPLPTKELAAELAKYPNATSIRWVQEEPENQGAWYYLAQNLPAAMEKETSKTFAFDGVGRPTASAPSVGSHHVHDEQQAELMRAALAE